MFQHLLKYEMVTILATGFMAFLGQASPTEGPMNLVLQFGALGLCCLMVYQNDRSRREAEKDFKEQRLSLLEVIAEQQEDARAQRDRLEMIHKETMDVMRRCTK